MKPPAIPIGSRERPAGPRAALGALAPAALIVAALASGCAGTKGAPPGAPPALPDAAVRVEVATSLQAGDSALADARPGDAREAYQRARELARGEHDRGLEARAEAGFGIASLELGEPDQARRSLLRSVDLDPTSAKAHTGLGRYFAASRRYRDARVEFERAALLDSLDPEPLYRLGIAYAEAGETRNAQQSLGLALARNPEHAPSKGALRALLADRYRAAGLPPEYPELRDRMLVSRGELGVMLAVELGLDPGRPVWQGAEHPPDTPDARGAWGEPLLRASIARGWIAPFPDGSYHLEDPVTRGGIALLTARVWREWPRDRGSDSDAVSDPVPAAREERGFPDLGPRHYLFRAAKQSVDLGIPLRPGGRFDPWASATGLESYLLLRGLSRSVGARPLLAEEPAALPVVR